MNKLMREWYPDALGDDRLSEYASAPVWLLNMQQIHIQQCEHILMSLGIEKVIYNDKATIIFFKDGTKSVVKAHSEDANCPDGKSDEAGLALAFLKHMIGEKHFHYVMDALLGNKGQPYVFKYYAVGRELPIDRY